MTFRGALKKKFGRGLLGSLLFYSRVWHVFHIYAVEYLKDATDQEKARFRKVFGE